MEKFKIYKEASILLIAAFLVFSTVAVTANTTDVHLVASTGVNTEGEYVNPGSQSIGGALIWDNGDPDFVDGLCCQRIGSVTVCDTADDFHTDDEYTIAGAVWETVDDATYEWGEIDDLIIYEDTGAGPGTPVVELWDVPNTREYLGEQFGRPWYRYTIDLVAEEMEFDLPAGDYFLLLRPVTAGAVGQSFWLTSPGHPDSESEVYFRSEYFGYPDWVPGSVPFGVPYDVNFKLYGEGTGPKPELEIGDITGGFGISSVIKNVGDDDATNVEWSIKFDGGIIILPSSGEATGGPVDIAAAGEEPINTMVFGFGGFLQSLNVTVSADADNADPVEKTVAAKVFLFFVII